MALKQIKCCLIFLIFSFICAKSYAQKDTLRLKRNPYKLNYYADVPITVAGLIASKYGTDYLRGREPKNMERIPFLKPTDIWWFDRGATKQDPSQVNKYLSISTTFMRGAMFIPVVMYLDPNVRDIWIDFALLHVETQAINASAYLAASIPVPRLRPFMYNPEESMERKLGRNTTNSFFSGHASVVAASTFFMVKVYYDLHPEAKNKLLFYGLASIPPAITGYCRYKGAKHFPSDIMMGIAVGATLGILVPELHKRNTKIKLYPTAVENRFGFYTRISLN